MEDRLDCGRDDKVDEEGPPEECLPHLKRQLRSGAAEKPPSPWTPNPKSVGLPQVDGPESGLFLVVVLGNSKSTIHRRRQLCILRTWGAGISVVFPDHHMWSMFALMHHVYGKYRGFSWYIFMDDRTWVNVPALTKFLETKSPHVLEYGGTGVTFPAQDKVGVPAGREVGMLSGGFYVNRDTLEVMGQYFSQSDSRNTWGGARKYCHPFGFNDIRAGGCIVDADIPFVGNSLFGKPAQPLCEGSESLQQHVERLKMAGVITVRGVTEEMMCRLSGLPPVPEADVLSTPRIPIEKSSVVVGVVGNAAASDNVEAILRTWGTEVDELFIATEDLLPELECRRKHTWKNNHRRRGFITSECLSVGKRDERTRGECEILHLPGMAQTPHPHKYRQLLFFMARSTLPTLNPLHLLGYPPESGVASGVMPHLAETFPCLQGSQEFLGSRKKWYIMADSDTTLNVEPLLHLLSSYDEEVPLMIGQLYDNGSHHGYLTGGAGYIISVGAVERIAQHCIMRQGKGCEMQNGEAADTWLGDLLHSLGATLINEEGFFQQSILNGIPQEYRAIPTYSSHRSRPLKSRNLPSHKDVWDIFLQERKLTRQCQSKE